MEQISQLKTMRDDALHRLESNPDFRLVTSLDKLIVELEDVVAKPRPELSIVEPVKSTEEEVEDVIEQMSAELEEMNNKDDKNKDSKISAS